MLMISPAIELLYVLAGLGVIAALIYGAYVMVHRTTRPEGAAAPPGDAPGQLLEPQAAEVEEYFGVTLPADVRWLYNKPEILTQRQFEIHAEDGGTHTIKYFLPLRVATIEQTWFPIGDRRLPIAIDHFGNYLFIDVDHASLPTAVFYIDHDGGATWPVASSLRQLFQPLSAE